MSPDNSATDFARQSVVPPAVHGAIAPVPQLRRAVPASASGWASAQCSRVRKLQPQAHGHHEVFIW
eukprot:4042496-Pyramimonas_sp.AAC.1